MFHPIELFFGLGIFAWILSLLYIVFWVWMLIDCLQNRRLSDMEKLVWVLVLLFLHVIGPLLYFFIGREPKASI
ncbi:MAG TPA: PLDc N-terminal domain-containing protein [Pirellulales bacterium]